MRVTRSVLMMAAVVAVTCAGRVRPLGADTRTFPAQPGDTVIVQNDYGRVQVRAADRTDIQVSVNTRLGPGTGEHLNVAAQKAGDKVFLYAFFGSVPGESADLELDIPGFVNLIVWGANPEVTLQGLGGYVRVNTITGHIGAENLTGSVSLISDRGDITYHQTAQPKGDARLESTQGTVRGELGGNLNLRVWARAGGKLSVAGDSQPDSLEKQLGTLGPLLYVSSLQGNVQVDVGAFTASPARPTRPAGNEGPISGSVPAGETPQTAPKPAPRQEPRPAPPPREREETSGQVMRPQPGTQPGAATTDSAGNPTFKVNVDWVFLNVSVRERNTNRSIAGLRQDDFVVYEDGMQQQVEQFEPTEVPFNLLLLLDISGSTESFIDLIKTASIDFTRQIKSNDRVAVATFNSRVQLIQDFTSDRAEVARSIERIRSGGGTSFYDALDTCVGDYIQGAEGRKAIVVFTDGVDNRLSGGGGQGSSISFEQLYRKIQEIDPIIYPIFLDTERDAGGMTRYPGGTNTGGVVGIILGDILRGRRTGPVIRGGGGGGYNPAAYQQARQQLEMIAEQTGGRMYSPRVAEDLRGVYSEIADDLRIQYRLGYNSTNKSQNGAWREIRVRLRDQPNAVVRTRKGYYARPGQPRNG